MKKLFLSMLLCFVFANIHAQKHTVKLQLVEKASLKPIEYVGCEVKTADNQSGIVDFAPTDSLGKVSFMLPKGRYRFEAVYMGEVLFSRTTEVAADIDFGKIYVSNEILLSEVSVKSYRPSLKHKNGNLIFNVKSSPLSKNYTANDLLARTPLLTLSGAGVSIEGGAAELRINGIKQNLSGTALISFLNSLKSDDVKQIEVQSGRTADVDANLPGGVVNIVLEHKKGVNGYVESKLNDNGKSYEKNATRLFKASGGAALTLGTEALHFYANIYGSGGRSHGIKSKSDYLIKPIGKFIHESGKLLYKPSKYVDANFGLTYKANENNTLKAELGFEKTPTIENTYDNHIKLSNSDFFIDSLFTNSKIKSSRNYYSVTCSHHWKSTHKKAKLNTIFNYLHNKHEEEQNIQTQYQIQTINNATEINTLFNKSSMFYAQTKFDYTFDNEIHTIVGVKYTRTKRQNDNHFSSDKVDDSNMRYNFTEELPAFFVNIDKNFSEKLFLSIGLRAEYTKLKSDNSVIKIDYFDLFPSLLLSYKLPENWFFRLNYSRSVFRPAFALLNNYKIKISDYLYAVGNPTLKAQKTDYLKIGFSQKNHSINLSYSYSSNPISENIYAENKIVFIKNVNSGKMHNISLNYSYNGRIIPIWYLSANSGISYLYFPESMYEKETVQAYISLYNNIKVSEKIELNINSKYATPWIMNDRKVDERFSLDFNAKYNIVKKLTFSFGIKNLLSKRSSSSISDNIYTHYDYWCEKAFRTYFISLVYNFSKGEKFRKQRIKNENTDRYRVY